MIPDGSVTLHRVRLPRALRVPSIADATRALDPPGPVLRDWPFTGQLRSRRRCALARLLPPSGHASLRDVRTNRRANGPRQFRPDSFPFGTAAVPNVPRRSSGHHLAASRARPLHCKLDHSSRREVHLHSSPGREVQWRDPHPYWPRPSILDPRLNSSA
jgi:hypothetical protein